MSWIGLVSAGEADPGAPLPGFEDVGGITLVERQLRQALQAGAEAVWLLAPDLPQRLSYLEADERVHHVATAEALRGLVDGNAGQIMVFQPAMLIDERLIAHMAREMATKAAVPALLVYGEKAPPGAERLDAASHWAGLMRVAPDLLRDTIVRMGEWELIGTLLRTAVESGAGRIPVEGFPTYAANRRRTIDFLWFLPQNDAERKVATEALLRSAQKGCLDWPARFIHPPIENQLTRWLLPTPVTPNQVTVIGGILGFIAMYLFAVGQFPWALALVLVVGPLDGLDGKLARTRHQFSRWGDLEHALDKILEYGWFLAIGWWFSTNGHGIAAWMAVWFIIIASLSEAIKGEWFRRFTGRQLDDWGAFERRFRIIGGRRNTYFWSWIPFGVFGLWWEGLLFLMVYAVLTWAVSEWRFLLAVSRYGRETSENIRKNFEQTAYAFLPQNDDSLAESQS